MKLSGGVENDWLEFKATLCPPRMDVYAADRDCLDKYTKGDYQIHVVKAVVSLMNGHGGAVVVGVAQEAGRPVPTPAVGLCESPQLEPELLAEVGPTWDMDKWLLHVRNVLRENEWVDRYGTTWNCSEVIDDPRVLLLAGVFHRRPVIVIVVNPAKNKPVELRRSIPIGRPARKGQQKPPHCVRRATEGKSCHWPHDDPEIVTPSVVPFRVRGDTASTEMKWSFADAITQWSSRRPEQVRFAELDRRERGFLKGLPFGTLPAIESILALSHGRALQQQRALADGGEWGAWRLQSEDGTVQSIDRLVRDAPRTRNASWLTGTDARTLSAVLVELCLCATRDYMLEDQVPVLILPDVDLGGNDLSLLKQDHVKYVTNRLLPKLGGSASTAEHWHALSQRGWVHVFVALDDVSAASRARVVRALLAFSQANLHSRLTMASIREPSSSYKRFVTTYRLVDSSSTTLGSNHGRCGPEGANR
jgi:hypothetical protein